MFRSNFAYAQKKPPCYFCPEDKRYPGCHDDCSDYKDWEAEKICVSEKLREDGRRLNINNRRKK